MEEKRYDTYPIKSCTIDITEACNLACTYCFTWGNTNRVLDLKLGKEIVDFFFDHVDPKDNHYELSFWGGEPLLQYRLVKLLILYAERKSKKVVFGGTTNGLLLDKEKLEFFRDHKGKFMISIDGVKEVHDKYRVYKDGRGSWDDLKRRIPAVLNVWPDARFRMSLSTGLVPYLFESVKWLYSEGVRWIAFSPVFEEDWREENLKLLEEQLILLADFMNKHQDFSCKHLSDPGSGIWQDYPCGAGRSYVGFSVDGKIYPCHRFNKYGNAKKNKEAREKWSIGDIWTGFNEKRQVFLDYPKLRKEQCGECSVYKFCAGGCYAVLADLTGSIFGLQNGFCEYEKLLFKIGNTVKHTKQKSKKSCVCFNMCYMEGSEKEIFYRDKSSGESCICFNTRYDGPMDPPNTRRLI